MNIKSRLEGGTRMIDRFEKLREQTLKEIESLEAELVSSPEDGKIAERLTMLGNDLHEIEEQLNLLYDMFG